MYVYIYFNQICTSFFIILCTVKKSWLVNQQYYDYCKHYQKQYYVAIGSLPCLVVYVIVANILRHNEESHRNILTVELWLLCYPKLHR